MKQTTIRRIEVQYDNRFGFARYAKAFWVFDPSRVGEQFLFTLPNGLRISVIRTARWDYNRVNDAYLAASSHGFAQGLYELLATDVYGKILDLAGYLNHCEIQKRLSKYRNWK